MNKKILVGVAALSFSLVAARSFAQSPLVDLAKAERDRRASLQTASRVYKNEDLRVYPPPVVVPVEPSLNVSFSIPRFVEEPTVSVYGYDKWWPFDGPPEPIRPQSFFSISTFVGRHRAGVGQRNRVGSREPIAKGAKSWK